MAANRSIRERLDELENQVGQFTMVASSVEQLVARTEMVEKTQHSCNKVIEAMGEDTSGLIQALQEQLRDINARVNLLTKMVSTTSLGGTKWFKKVKIPEPKHYGGARDAEELGNFLFDVEQYFNMVKPESELTKVYMATMYLTGDAKLWWRTCYANIQNGVVTIDTWEDLKRELKNQFLPYNIEFITRRKLMKLQQTGTVHEYERQFSVLMLDIQNMSEEDKFFYFMDGLKPWAQTELWRQNVQDLASAKLAALRLIDYAVDMGDKKKLINDNNSKPPSKQDKGGKSEQKGQFNKKVSSSKQTSKAKQLKCFLCAGPHRVAVCPEKSSLQALQSTFGNEEHSQGFTQSHVFGCDE